MTTKNKIINGIKNAIEYMRIIKIRKFSYLIFFVSIIVCLTSNNDMYTLYVACLMSLVAGLIFFISDIKNNYIATIFYLSIFFFLLGRFLIRWADGLFISTRNGVAYTALMLVYLALLGTYIGYIIASWRGSIKEKRKIGLNIKEKKSRIFNYIDRNKILLNKIMWIGFVVTITCMYVNNMMQYFAYSGNYVSFYSNGNVAPAFIQFVSELSIYFVAGVFALFPDKKKTITVGLIYVLSFLPSALMGKRNLIISAFLVFVVYYLMRYFLAKKNKEKIAWISIKERLIVVFFLLISIAFLSYIEVARFGQQDKYQFNLFDNVKQLIHSQGITLDVVGDGLVLEDKIPEPYYKSYTFSNLIDHYVNNPISQIVFSNNGNKIKAKTLASAEAGLSLGDSLSYLVFGRDKYIKGSGTGSSYILEAYFDFGKVGVFLIGIFLGVLLFIMQKNISRRYIGSYLIIIITSTLFMVPRSSVSSVLYDILYVPQFILIICIIITVYIINRLRLYYEK